METSRALGALAALSHDLRLAAFRRLAAAGPDGLAAGALATHLGAKPNTLSSALSILHSAGLVASRRDGRSVIYMARIESVGELLDFLVEDCCGGQPQLCRVPSPNGHPGPETANDRCRA